MNYGRKPSIPGILSTLITRRRSKSSYNSVGKKIVLSIYINRILTTRKQTSDIFAETPTDGEANLFWNILESWKFGKILAKNPGSQPLGTTDKNLVTKFPIADNR